MPYYVSSRHEGETSSSGAEIERSLLAAHGASHMIALAIIIPTYVRGFRTLLGVCFSSGRVHSAGAVERSWIALVVPLPCYGSGMPLRSSNMIDQAGQLRDQAGNSRLDGLPRLVPAKVKQVPAHE